MFEQMENDYDTVMKSKTSVSWIEEISRKQGNKPTFNFDETKSKGPPFTCILELTYKDAKLRAVATSNSKKDAKQNVAKVMLNDKMKLTPKDYYEINGGTGAAKSNSPATDVDTPLASSSSSSSTLLLDSDILINSVGDLLELCEKLSLGPPEYDPKEGIGPPHMPTFECFCVVNGESKSETGKNKKEAKRMVAYQWLMTLRGRQIAENVDSSRTNGESLSQADQPDFIKLPCSGTLEECSTIVAHKNHLYQKLGGDLVNKLKCRERHSAILKSFGGVEGFLVTLGQESNLEISFDDNLCMDDSEVSFLCVVSIKATNRQELDLVLLESAATKEKARELAAKEALDAIETFVK